MRAQNVFCPYSEKDNIPSKLSIWLVKMNIAQIFPLTCNHAYSDQHNMCNINNNQSHFTSDGLVRLCEHSLPLSVFQPLSWSPLRYLYISKNPVDQPFNKQIAFIYDTLKLPHINLIIHRRRCQPCKVTTNTSEAFMVMCLAQGHLDTYSS